MLVCLFVCLVGGCCLFVCLFGLFVVVCVCSFVVCLVGFLASLAMVRAHASLGGQSRGRRSVFSWSPSCSSLLHFGVAAKFGILEVKLLAQGVLAGIIVIVLGDAVGVCRCWLVCLNVLLVVCLFVCLFVCLVCFFCLFGLFVLCFC